MISVFGSTGFIGSKWMELYPDVSYPEPRDSISSEYDNILYFRATNSNYNVFSDLSLDVKTNLVLLTDTFQNLTPNNTFNLIGSWFALYPKGFYSATKLCQEHLTESFCKTFGIKYRILRLSNIIGGDNRKSAKKNALEFLINKLKNDENIEIYEGDNYRNYLDVRDCCRAIKFILDSDFTANETWNIGDTTSYKLIELIDYCKEKIGSKSNIKRIPIPNFHKTVQIKDFWFDTKHLYNMGFKKQYSIQETLSNLCSK